MEHFDWAELSLATACRVSVAAAQGRASQAERLGTLAHQQYLRSDYLWTVLLLAPALTAARAYRGDASGAQDAIEMIRQTGIDAAWLDLAANAVMGEVKVPSSLLVPPAAPDAGPSAYNLFDVAMAALQAEVCDVNGDADLARAALGPLQAAQAAGFAHVIGWVGSVPRLLGVLYKCLGRYDEAETWLRSAVAQAGRAPAPAELARSQVNLGEVLLARSEHEAAAAAVSEAGTVFRQLDLPSLLDRCERLRPALSPVHPRS
jgi:tetratricopeptide (TPR) repeat protein